MPVCKFFLQGNCKFGDRCRFDHPQNAFQDQTQNRFSAFQNPPNSFRGNQNAPQGGSFRGQSSRDLPYHLDPEIIKADLTTDRPIWFISAYGPGRDPPKQMFGGPLEHSFEELRVKYYLAQASGNVQPAIQMEQELLNKAEGQIQTVLSDLNGACQYIIGGKDEHPNRWDVCKGSSPTDSSNQPQASQPQNPFQSAPAGPSAFGQPSALGFSQQKPAFGQPSFGQPSAPGAAQNQQSAFGQPSSLGQQSAFGQPSALGQNSAFGKPSAFGQPSLVQPSSVARNSAFGQQPQGSAFGQPSQSSAFGQASALGQTSAFGQASALGQTSTFGKPSAFGQPSTPGQTSAFGKPSAFGAQPSAFGQPSNSAFGQTSALGGSSPSPFSQPTQQAQPNPFGQPKATAFGTPAAGGFGQPSTQSAASPFGAPANTGSSSSWVQPAGQTAAATTTSPFGQSPAPATNGFSTIASPFGQTATPAFTTIPNGTSSSAQASSSIASGTYNSDVSSYSTRDGAGRLTSWKGKPVRYIDNEPHYQISGNDWERIWFPDGPPRPNPDAEAPADKYNDVLAQAYSFLRDNGRFKDGVMPEIPPMRAWIRWDL